MTGTIRGFGNRTETDSRSGRLARLLRTPWLQVMLLICLGVVVRAPALSGQLIWDDEYLARDNPFIKSPILVFEVFRHYLFLDSFSAHYRPSQNLSLIADYWFWNSNTFGFHLTNVLLHVGSGVLLYFLLRRLFASLAAREIESINRRSLPPNAALSLAAFLAAMIWTVHPVHSAAVDYISGRADSLAFFFAAAGWLLYLRAPESRSRPVRTVLYSLGAFSGLLALCSRETAVIWLVIFLLHALSFRKDLCRASKLITAFSCITLFGVYAGLRQLPEARAERSPPGEWPNSTRVVLMLRALGDYGRLMIFPSNLHMERDVLQLDNYRSADSWKKSASAEYLSVVGLAVAGALAGGCLRAGKGRGTRIFGAVWFVAGFLPISNLLDLNSTVAEHWLYSPSVGLLVFVAGCAMELPARMRKFAVAAACCALLGLSIRSAMRSSDWSSPETFYERTIAAGGGTARVQVNLGHLYAERGEYAKAEALFRKVLVATPDYHIARSNLADVLARQGKKEQAAALFANAARDAAAARRETPRTWLALWNLAEVRHEEKNDAAALAILDQARIDYPQVWELVSLEAELLRQAKSPAPALRLVSGFAVDHWWHYGAALALGRLYAEAGDTERAAAALRHASWLDIHEVDALNLLAQMRVRQHRLNDAYVTQKRAVSRQPNAPREYLLLSDILEKMGRTAEAKNAIAEVTRLEAIGRQSGSLAD